MNWRPRSLLARILLVEALSAAVALVVLPTLAASRLQALVERYQIEAQRTQIIDIAGGLRVTEGHIALALPAALSSAYSSGYDGRAFAVFDARGRAVAGAPAAATPVLARALRTGRERSFAAGGYRGVSAPVAVDGRRLWVVVGQDESRPGAILDDVVAEFLRQYVWALVAALALLALINVLAYRRLARALRRVSGQAARIDASTLATRLDERELPSELTPLARAANGLLGRLEASFASQRQFVANVVHELRMPLATLKMELDRLPDRERRGQIDRALDRVAHVISQLRDLAALETVEGHGRTFDLRAAAETAASEVAPALLDGGDRLAVTLAPASVPVTGEPVLVSLAIANLLGNAGRHTPPGTAIELTVGADGTVTVADDGPGIAGGQLALVTRRFWRADQSRTDGAGLGLSIVQRIAEVHGGTLSAGERAGGGACFTLTLPLAAAEAQRPSGAKENSPER